LKRLGFDVETVLDPSRTALEGAIRRYGDRSVGAEVSLFQRFLSIRPRFPQE
jgi:hypothetical protein